MPKIFLQVRLWAKRGALPTAGLMMPAAIFSCFACILIFGCAHRSQSLLAAPDAAMRERTFDYYWSHLRDEYKYFEHNSIDWDNVRSVYRPLAIQADDKLSYYQAIAGMISKLRDPHAYFSSSRFPQNVVGAQGPLRDYTLLGVRTVRIGKQHYVRSWGLPPAPPITEDRSYPLLLQAGPALLTSMYTAASDVAYWVNIDSEYTVKVQYANGDVRVLQTLRNDSMRRLRGGQEALSTVVVNIPRPVLMSGTRLAVPAQPEIERTYIGADGSEYSDVVMGLTSCDEVRAERGELFVSAGHRKVIGRERPWWIGVARAGECGYIRISTFDPRNSRRQRDFSGEIGAALEEIGDVKSIIIDVRRNGGGVDIAVLESLSWFLPNISKLDGDAVLFNRRYFRKKHAFTGKVVVLVDEVSASGAEVFTWAMREYAGAKLVGETTSGAGAGVAELRGPDGSWLYYGRYPLNTDHDPMFQTIGLTPDITIANSIERVREIGYANACMETEERQFRAACEILNADADAFMFGD